MSLADSCLLCIAGDDDQSIYSRRYANPDWVLAYMGRDDVEADESWCLVDASRISSARPIRL